MKKNKKEDDIEVQVPFADIFSCFMDGLKSSGKRKKDYLRKEKNKWKKR